MTALPVNVPVNFNSAFWLCVGPPPGVNAAPDGTVSAIVVALDSVSVAKPPKIPSSADIFALTAAVPQEPTRSPVKGAVKFLFGVSGSEISASYLIPSVPLTICCFV